MLDSVIFMEQIVINPLSLSPQNRRRHYVKAKTKAKDQLDGFVQHKKDHMIPQYIQKVQFEDSKAEKGIKIMKLQHKMSKNFSSNTMR